MKLLLKSITLVALVSYADEGSKIYWPASNPLPEFPAPHFPLDVVQMDGLTKASARDESYLLSSLQGLVNKNGARIYLDGPTSEGRGEWLRALKIPSQALTFNDIVKKYRSYIKCAVSYDETAAPSKNGSLVITLATVAASQRGCVLASPMAQARLKDNGIEVPVIEDFGQKLKDKYEVNDELFRMMSPVAAQSPLRLVLSLSPNITYYIRELSFALPQVSSQWFQLFEEPVAGQALKVDPREQEQLKKFRKLLAPDAAALGFPASETIGIPFYSSLNMPMYVADFYANYSLWSGYRPQPLRPWQRKSRDLPLENKVYVAFHMSEGDNMSYIQHRLKLHFDKSTGRGLIPINWAISPALVHAGPQILQYFFDQATPNESFIMGPSGLAYTNPVKWGESARRDYWRKTGEYMKATGIHSVFTLNQGARFTEDDAKNILATNPDFQGVSFLSGATESYLTPSAVPVVSAPPIGKPKNEIKDWLVKDLRTKIAAWKKSGKALFLSYCINAWDASPQVIVDAVKEVDEPALTPLLVEDFFPLMKKGL